MLHSVSIFNSAISYNNNNRIQKRCPRFFAISSQCCELSPTRTLKWPRRNRVQITCNTSSAYHVQHVVLRATWYEGTAQLLSLTELKSHLFELYFVGWIIKPMKEGRKPEYTEKTPGDELQKMPHTTARRFKPQARLEPAQQHRWQARKADMLTVTPRVFTQHFTVFISASMFPSLKASLCHLWLQSSFTQPFTLSLSLAP